MRLIVLKGPEKGATFPCAAAQTLVGTAPESGVRLSDAYVSRRHGELLRRGDTVLYRDLGSRNGSWLLRGGQEIALTAEHHAIELLPGDVLRVGHTQLRVEEEEAPPRLPVVTSTQSTQALPRAVDAALSDREALERIYRLTCHLGDALDPNALLDASLDAMLEMFPQATHAAVVLLDRKTGQPVDQAGKVRTPEGLVSEAVSISMTLTRRVVEGGEAVVFTNVPEQIGRTHSVLQAGIHSSMCAPLWTSDDTLGLVQVDNRATDRPFSPRDLDLLLVVANRVALALTARNLYLEQQRARLVEDFSHYMVHDLQNPATVFAGWLQMLDQGMLGDLTQEQGEAVRDARLTAELFSEMVGSLADYVRLEKAELPLLRQPVSLRDSLEVPLKLARSLAGNCGLELIDEVPPDLPPVNVDARLIRRVVMNLLSNALKYAPAPGRITLSAQAEPKAGVVQLSVADTGPGIPDEFQDKIFDKFAVVEVRRAAEKRSIGLGLAFCKLAVEAHGGRIWVESEPGRGSTFLFTLPVAG
jgi:signal transduction histidine kinase